MKCKVGNLAIYIYKKDLHAAFLVVTLLNTRRMLYDLIMDMTVNHPAIRKLSASVTYTPNKGKSITWEATASQ
jgi:hypothetical protein